MPRSESGLPFVGEVSLKRSSAALIVVAVLGVSSGAAAYVRQTVMGDPSTPLFWQRRLIEVRPAYDSCADVAPGEVRNAVLASMEEWMLAGGSGCTDLILVEGEPPSGLDTNLDGGMIDRQNRIVWREAWPDMADPSALAITTIVYETASGEIQDADIDVNAEGFFWTAGDAMIVNDIQNTVTHEIGHLIGLAHTGDSEATMFASSAPGDVAKRTLHPDDIDGICTIYPVGGDTPGGLGRTSGMLTSVSTCSAAPIGVAGPALAPVWLAAIVLAFGRRRRR